MWFVQSKLKSTMMVRSGIREHSQHSVEPTHGGLWQIARYESDNQCEYARIGRLTPAVGKPLAKRSKYVQW